jgi:hypothetical protein
VDRCDICKRNPWKREVLANIDGEGTLIILSLCGEADCESRYAFSVDIGQFSLDNSLIGKV